MILFACTLEQRKANNDSRLSLEERYTNHAGYVGAVRSAVAKAITEGFLLAANGDALITAAQQSKVLQ